MQVTNLPSLDVHRIGVGGLCIHNNEVLMVKYSNKENIEHWNIPGGLVELGESLQNALKREIWEETGIDVITKAILLIRHMTRESRMKGTISDLYIVFETEFVSGTPQPKSQEISDVKFIPLKELRKHSIADLTLFILENKEKITRISPVQYQLSQYVKEERKIQQYNVFTGLI